MEIQSALIGAGGALALTACLLSACTTLGAGRSTLVLATPVGTPSYPGQEFNQFIASPDRQLIGLGGRGAFDAQAWSDFKDARYGASAQPIARVDVNVRDQTTTPALDLFNIETANASDVAKVLADKTLSMEQRRSIITGLHDAYREMPESYSRLVLSRVEDGRMVYNYYPTVTVDLTGILNSPEPSDRFDMVAVAIRIPDNVLARFINFSPKAADLFDFTLGQLKQTASATGTLTAGDTLGTSSSATRTPSPASSSVSGATGSLGLNGSLSVTASDEFTRDLKGSLDARSTGIFEGGKLFIAQLRANDQRKIAGTYTFDVMLEIPSTVDLLPPPRDAVQTQKVMESVPGAKVVVGDIRVLALVRHVKKVGQTGLFKRVPEPTNDDVFQEAVVRDLQAPLWTFNNMPTANIVQITNLKVFTNQDEASFSVYDQNDVMLKRGTGRDTDLALATAGKVRIVFDPVITAGGAELEPPNEAIVTVGKTASVVGNYTVRTAEGGSHVR